MTSPTGSLGEVLTALDALIGVRLEQRAGDAIARPSDDDGADALPAAATLRAHGPLADVMSTAGLSPAEALVALAAVAPAIDERYDALYRRLSDRQDAPGLTGDVARTLVARTLEARLAATAMLSPRGRLRAMGLLDVEAPGTMAARLAPDPELVSWLLGLPEGVAAQRGEFPARALSTVHSLDDVVLPGPARDRVDDLVARIAHRDLVVGEWGFGAHHDNTAGLVALFHGPPGTGKTMTAAAIARSTGLPAHLVDLSSLISKYIGETEKHLAAIFDRAARERCILVFDEADAIFGRRTEVADAHDRYANQEVSYLLSRIEQHPGVVILTTNLLANIDDAFQRRIHVMVEFPSPGVAERTRLWRTVLPPALPVDDAVDLDDLAHRYPLTGAQIRDAGLDAAYLAASAEHTVTHAHLVDGVRRQFEKAGRTAPR